jgi:hypothetical protein
MMMQISYTDRKELDTLSKNVFGVSSRWQKLIEKGHPELVVEDKTETVPPAKEGDEPTTRVVKVPVLSKTGAKQYTIKRYTLETVKDHMLECEKQLAVIREQIKKMEEEKKNQEENEKRIEGIHELLAGSARK